MQANLGQGLHPLQQRVQHAGQRQPGGKAFQRLALVLTQIAGGRWSLDGAWRLIGLA